MKEFFRYELAEEDELMFVLTDAVRQTPEVEVMRQLLAFIARHPERVRWAGTPRAAEMEELSTEFARLLLYHMEHHKTPPQHKSYALQT